MKIFLTGGGGFIGGALAKRLVSLGHNITNYGRGDYPQLSQIGVKCIKGDIQDYTALSKAMENHDLVYHVAAKVAMWGRWEDFYNINVKGTDNIIRSCQENKISKLIYTSSPSVIFGQQGLEGVDETTPYPHKFLGHYGRSKSIAEAKVLKANSEQLLTISLRPHLVFGPGDMNLIPKLIEARKRNRLKIIGSGRNKVDVLYIDNAVDAHLNALENINKNSAGKAYFIGQGPVELWSFINTVLKKKELAPITKSISFKKAFYIGSVIEFILRIFKIYNVHPPMSRFMALQLSQHHYYDHSRAKSLIKWSPKISIKEALEITLTE